MEKIIQSVRRRFITTIILVVAFVLGISWGILQWYSNTELSTTAHISEVYKSSENNPAFAEYIEDQKAYEAHFVTLASDIKQQEADRVTSALALTTAIVVTVGVVTAIVVARRLVKPVEEAYRSQERFIQDAAHEFRNPLAALTVALQQADKQTKKIPLVKVFQRQTKRLVHINEDLLFLERRTDEKLQSVSISDLLDDVIEELQPLAQSRNITLKVDNQKGLTKTINTNDYVRLMKNIIDNSIKYSPDGKNILITQKKDKGTIKISVTDQGIGIPSDDLTIIGSRFFRASNTGKIDGTGLGLAIVQKILNSYGGSKEITSTQGKGTKVKINLPA